MQVKQTRLPGGPPWPARPNGAAQWFIDAENIQVGDYVLISKGYEGPMSEAFEGSVFQLTKAEWPWGWFEPLYPDSVQDYCLNMHHYDFVAMTSEELERQRELVKDSMARAKQATSG